MVVLSRKQSHSSAPCWVATQSGRTAQFSHWTL